jgi:hypothetical protein
MYNTRATTAFTRKYYLEQHKLVMPTAQEAEDAVQFGSTAGESPQKKFQSTVGGIDSIGQRSAPTPVKKTKTKTFFLLLKVLTLYNIVCCL